MTKQNGNTTKRITGKRALTPAKARAEQWKVLIIDLYLQGNTMERVAEIAKERTNGHKFSTSTVHKYVRDAIQVWREQKQDLISEYMVIELAKINRMEVEYWNAWERSCAVRGKITRMKNKNSDDGKLAVSTVKEDSAQGLGDWRFMDGIKWCVEKRLELLRSENMAQAVTINNNIQNNVQNNIENKSTTLIRRVVFKTREVIADAQTMIEDGNGE